jgi:5-(carboxyamino)imidazole ribonucleotide mutase
MKPLVGIIMGSKSDLDTLQSAADTLQRLGVPFETRVVSAHRTPDLLFEYASTARSRGLEVIIAGAGGAAHLPGMILGIVAKGQDARVGLLDWLDHALPAASR